MYVTAVPNRNSPPAILLRESYREDGKVKTRTIANITHLRPAQIEALRSALSGSASVTGLPLPDAFRTLGHSRDDKSGTPQIVFGLLTNAEGCPVAVEVFDANTSDPKTVATQVDKLRHRFGLQRIVLVGDRGMITSARIREDLPAAHGIEPHLSRAEWISALRATQIQKLARDGRLQMSFFDKTDIVEIAHPDFPGERLVACFNPLLAEERARKRPELLAATEKQLEKIAATERSRRPLRGKQNIGLRAGKILNRYKMGKHFELHIEEDSFRYKRKEANIEREQSLDGIYVIRTSVKADALSGAQVVASYKSLSGVERAFRSLKTVDLHVRPIHHRLPDRVRAHILLCMLAYYVEWHMRQLLAPILFDDHDKPQAQAARASIVAPARRSDAARRKAAAGKTDDGLKVHSFQTLLGDLATIAKNRIRPTDKKIPAFDMLTTPTRLQHRALALLGVTSDAGRPPSQASVGSSAAAQTPYLVPVSLFAQIA